MASCRAVAPWQKTAVTMVCALLMLSAAMAGRGAQREEPLVASEMWALENVVKRAPLQYPAIARAARIEQVLRVNVLISSSGQVTSAQAQAAVLPQFSEAARDAVLQWQFNPMMVDGHAVPTQTVVTVFFLMRPPSTADVLAIASSGDLNRECQMGVDVKDFSRASVTCRKAVDAAAALPKGYGADVARPTDLLGRALAGEGKMEEAATEFERAISFLPSPRAAKGEACRDAARAHRALGHQDQALRFYDCAQDQIKGVLSVTPPAARGKVAAELRDVLGEYADALDDAGRAKDAAKARASAQNLK